MKINELDVFVNTTRTCAWVILTSTSYTSIVVDDEMVLRQHPLSNNARHAFENDHVYAGNLCEILMNVLKNK